MIHTAVVVPHPPLLLRELSGAADVAADLRAACLGELREALPAADAVVLVGGADRAASWGTDAVVTPRSFGPTAPPPDAEALPLSLALGRRLLDEAGWTGPVRAESVAWDAGVEEVTEVADRLRATPGRALLVVAGDGSARRGEKAPGHLDPRAAVFDDAIARALAGGDAKALEGLDPVLAADLLVAGRAALAVLGAVARLGGCEPRGRLAYRDDPFGVTYLVARWDLAGQSR